MQYVEISTDFSAAHFLESEFIHGHNFKVKVKFYGNSGNDGMVVDFDKAKDTLDEICNKFDHKVMLSESSVDSNITDKIKVRKKTYDIAKEDIVFLPISATTAEYVAEYIAKKLKEKFKTQNLKISVELEENYESSATFFV
ncbi:putative 6-carboxy-5,6,7,8-tetrahydropterin synthase [groundwater metagenome]|uniref:Putative 6-carboxy-5,6,7,8-tetrahydropterin synthase n=1 Tax=groundwater metagenome TaxID=717931 RepID=A0A098EBT3_9ZZZZ